MRWYIPIFLNWWVMRTYTSFKFYSPRMHVCHHTEAPLLPTEFYTFQILEPPLFPQGINEGFGFCRIWWQVCWGWKKWFLNVFSCLIKFRWRVNQNLNIPTPVYVNRHDVYKCISIRICIYASNVFMCIYILIYLSIYIRIYLQISI